LKFRSLLGRRSRNRCVPISVGGEASAVLIEATRKRLEQIQKALISLLAVVSSSGNAKLDAYVESQIDRAYRHAFHGEAIQGEVIPEDAPAPVARPRPARRDHSREVTVRIKRLTTRPPWRQYLYSVADLERQTYDWYCLLDEAHEGLKREHGTRGRRGGETLDEWIRRMADICKSYGLPTTNRHDGPKKISTFAKLIEALSRCFPRSYRPSVMSNAWPSRLTEALKKRSEAKTPNQRKNKLRA
jgi:hypothetical protein